jgi:hypothetical protein
MGDLAQVLEVMHTSSQRWNSIRLNGHEWRHYKTFGRAWEHRFDELRKRGSAGIHSIAFGKSDGGNPPEEGREEWQVWLEKPDKKRTQFQVGDHVVAAVFIGKRWWSWSRSGFKTNEGELNSSHGFGPAEGLVDPATHLSFLQISFDHSSTFLSRPAFLITAVPPITEPQGFSPTFHMLGTGADLYKLIVDAETGTLLRSQAEFEGHAFRVIQVDEIAVNKRFDVGVFDPDLLRGGQLEV